MKKLILFIVPFFFVSLLDAQEYLIVTTVESIVPAGIGRSRMVLQKEDVDAEELTTERTDGKTSNQKNVSRSKAKISNFEETKLLNFYSIAGINFQNIASNDAIITDKINTLSKEGWKLTFVASGVESDAGSEDNNGIFITRFIFYRE